VVKMDRLLSALVSSLNCMELLIFSSHHQRKEDNRSYRARLIQWLEPVIRTGIYH